MQQALPSELTDCLPALFSLNYTQHIHSEIMDTNKDNEETSQKECK